MTGANNWEVVGGKSKKSKQKNGTAKAPKDQKKKDDPAFEVSAPISEAHTIYEAFLEQEKKETALKAKITTPSPEISKNKGQSKKKKDKKGGASSKLSMEEVFSNIKEEEFKSHITTLEQLYPRNPAIWLKDVASFLNVKLDADVDDPSFMGKPVGYPSLLLKKGVYKLLLKLFNGSSQKQLLEFFEFCVLSMVNDALRGINSLGYLVVLQTLAQEHPSVAVAFIPKCLELCSGHQSRHMLYVSIMWATGQAKNNNLEAGFSVWTGLMFPLIGIRTCVCTSYVIDYLEQLVKSVDLSQINKNIIPVKDLFHILDFTYSKNVPKNVQKVLIRSYPTLKALSYGPEPETVLRNYFPSYLHRLQPHNSPAMRDEILSSLLYCLEKDSRNYSIWRQLYSTNVEQSKMLIAVINEHWGKLSSKFQKRLLFDTLSNFVETHKAALGSRKEESLNEECKLHLELMNKISSQMTSWIRYVVIFIFIISMLLTFDILVHDSFKESHTGRLMQDTGLLVLCAQAGEKLSYSYAKVYKQLEKYVPSVVTWTKKSISPYLELFWKQSIEACSYIWKQSSDFRTLCGKYIQPILLKVDAAAPIYGRWIMTLCRSLTIYLNTHLQTAIAFLWSLSESVALWAQSNDTVQNAVDSFVQYATVVIEVIQSQSLSVANFIKSYIPS